MVAGCVAVDNLTVSLDGNKILGPITWVPSGGVVGVVGPNGAGKTTLLKAIAGIISRLGRVKTCNRPAYMPAYPEVDPLATVNDIIRAGLYGLRPDYQYIKRVIRDLNIEGFLGRRFGHLSSGEKRLVCIARALARKSRVVLLDEPLSFLDVSNQAKVLEVLRNYVRNNDAQVLMTTHELHYLAFFDEVLVLKGGVPAYTGDPRKITIQIITKVYGVEVESLGPGIFIPRMLIGKGPSVR